MHRCGNGKESEDAGVKQLPLLFDVGQSRADDHSAKAMHQAGGQAAQRCPAQRYRRQILHEDGGVLPNRKADADGQGRGQDVLAVVAEKGGKHQYRQGLEEFLRHRRDGKVMRFEKSI